MNIILSGKAFIHKSDSGISNHVTVGTAVAPIANIFLARGLDGEDIEFAYAVTDDTDVIAVQELAFKMCEDGLSIVVQIIEKSIYEDFLRVSQRVRQVLDDHQRLLTEHQQLREELAALKEAR